MYIAHAGHQHIEAGIDQSISQSTIIAGVVIVVLAIVSILVIYDLRKKGRKSTTKSNN